MFKKDDLRQDGVINPASFADKVQNYRMYARKVKVSK